MPDTLRIAVAQTYGTTLAEWSATLATIEAAVDDAAAAGADLLLLPECVWPAYLLERPNAIQAAADEGMPDSDEFLARMRERARQRRMALCLGYVERRGRRLANAAALIDAAGELRGVHRKCFLWSSDHLCFEPGDQIRPFDTPFGRVGVLICADMRLPEIPATLVARGARLLLQPTAWVNSGTPERLWSAQADFMVRSRAAEFGVPIASADKCGSEHGTTFVGSSLICDAAGQALCQAGQRHAETLIADVPLARETNVNLTQAEREALRSPAAPVRPPGDEREAEVVITPDGWTAPEGVRLVALSAADARRFAPARVAALSGAQGIVFRGEAERYHLCTRAAENRLFVLSLDADGARLIDPRGRLSSQHAWRESRQVTWRLPLHKAADKTVAPRTDIWAGRTPALYEL